jgi:iron(III) transport system substrate-binding protein
MLCGIVGLVLTVSYPGSFAAAGEGKARWQLDWERTVQGATQEGQVVLYGSSVYQEVFREFQKKYPGIRVTHVSGTGTDIAQRMMTERRAGRYLGDLYLLGAGTGHSLAKGNVFDPIKPALILPEVVDESKWWKDRHKYMDDEGIYLFAFNEVALPFVGYNTKLVDPNEFKSYWDLLKPKWKGKMVAMDPAIRAAGDHLSFIYSIPELGPQYMRRLLGETDLTANRDARQIVDWLATGRYSISLFTSPSRAGLAVAKKQGLPVHWLGSKNLKEGECTSTTNGNVALLSRAPHPNAGRVALNWLLSREGQIEYQKFQQEANSLRDDIPKDHLPAYVRRLDGVRYFGIDNPERRKDEEPIRKIVEEVWKRGRS